MVQPRFGQAWGCLKVPDPKNSCSLKPLQKAAHMQNQRRHLDFEAGVEETAEASANMDYDCPSIGMAFLRLDPQGVPSLKTMSNAPYRRGAPIHRPVLQDRHWPVEGGAQAAGEFWANAPQNSCRSTRSSKRKPRR